VDKGPWELYYSSPEHPKLIGVISNDFERDVVLDVSGDFSSSAEKEAYCRWLLTVLNRPADQPGEKHAT
jgi:hypothetical protein